jgi:hypothetical protein
MRGAQTTPPFSQLPTLQPHELCVKTNLAVKFTTCFEKFTTCCDQTAPKMLSRRASTLAAQAFRGAAASARPVLQRRLPAVTAFARLSASTVKGGATSSFTSAAAAIAVLGGGFVGAFRWVTAPEVLLSPLCVCVCARAWSCACAARISGASSGLTQKGLPRGCLDSLSADGGARAGAGCYVTRRAGLHSGAKIQRGRLGSIQGGVGVGRWRRSVHLRLSGARAQNAWLSRASEGRRRATVVVYHGGQCVWLCSPRRKEAAARHAWVSPLGLCALAGVDKKEGGDSGVMMRGLRSLRMALCSAVNIISVRGSGWIVASSDLNPSPPARIIPKQGSSRLHQG